MNDFEAEMGVSSVGSTFFPLALVILVLMFGVLAYKAACYLLDLYRYRRLQRGLARNGQ